MREIPSGRDNYSLLRPIEDMLGSEAAPPMQASLENFICRREDLAYPSFDRIVELPSESPFAALLVADSENQPSQEQGKHLTYAQDTMNVLGIPLQPGSVTILSARSRHGRSLFKGVAADRRGYIIKVNDSRFIAKDAFTKFESRKHSIHAAGIATPEVIFSECANVQFMSPSQTEVETLNIQVQTLEPQLSWEAYLVSLQNKPSLLREERVKAYEQLGSIMKRLHSIPAEYRQGGKEYGQYADETGSIAVWHDFPSYIQDHLRYYDHLLLRRELAYPEIFSLDRGLIKQTLSLIEEETRCWTVDPHLIHGDMQLGNVLRDGTAIDWDHLGAGCLPMEWAKIVGNMRTSEEIADFQKGMCSSAGLGLTERHFMETLQDTYVMILMEKLDLLASRISKLKLDSSDLATIIEAERDTARKRDFLEGVNVLRQSNSSDYQEYLSDYQQWIDEIEARERGRETSKVILEAKKIISVQTRLAAVLNEVGSMHDGRLIGPRSWRAREARDAIEKAEALDDPEAVEAAYRMLESSSVHYYPMARE